jgi:hypothetical protein
VNRKLTPVLL